MVSFKTAPIARDETIHGWQRASWDEYLHHRDNPALDRIQLFFHRGYLLVDTMGAEGMNHAKFSDFLTILFFIWFSREPKQPFNSLGRCQLEKANHRAAAPDCVLYIGGNAPQWREGDRRFLNLDEWRVPDLVVEVSDTTLADDLERKMQLYAELNIPEYWIANVQAKQVLAFRLQADRTYNQCTISVALTGLPISLLTEALTKLETMDNGVVAFWIAHQLDMLPR